MSKTDAKKAAYANWTDTATVVSEMISVLSTIGYVIGPKFTLAQ